MKTIFASLLLLLVLGCAARKPVKPTGVNLSIAPDCQSKPAELLDCDLQTGGAPKCKNVTIHYRAECAVIFLKK